MVQSEYDDLPDIEIGGKIKHKTVDEIIEAGANHYVVLNDGETYTSAEGCFIIDHFGTVYDLMKIMDRAVKSSLGGFEKCMVGRLAIENHAPADERREMKSNL